MSTLGNRLRLFAKQGYNNNKLTLNLGQANLWKNNCWHN